ncbi:MAG: M1 family aminopeptidase, partial [Burkholderiales bacterium]
MFTIASFEFRSRLKLISTWVYFLVFFALALLWMAAAGGLLSAASVSFGSGKVAVNSAYGIAMTTSVLGIFGTTVMAAIMGRAVQQDFEYRTQTFFFTSPIGKLQYLGGRFLGALGVVLVVFASISLGEFIGTLLPGMDAERLGPNRLSAYLLPIAWVLLPNALLIGGVFFSLAATTRKMLPVYVGSVLVLIGWLLSSQLLADLDNKTLASMVDPFGSRALDVLTEYWTIAERNTRLIPLEGVLLWNRALWVGVGLLVCGLCFWRFSFTAAAQERVSKATRKAVAGAERPVAAPRTERLVARIDTSRPLALLPHLVWLNLRETIKNIYFGVLVLAGLLFMIFASMNTGSIFGTSTWPVTYQMTSVVSGGFSVFMLILIAFYGGEMVWRERENRLDQIVDGTPEPTWLPMLAKLLALMAIPLLLQAVLMLCGIGIQASKGYFHFEPGLYLQKLFGIDLLRYWMLCALAIAVHSIVNQKYIGHFVMIVYYVLIVFSSQLGLEHHLYKFADIPGAIYSDMNGFGHFMPRVRWFEAYWGVGSVLLLVAAYLMWTRGTVSSWRERLALARARLSAPVLGVTAVSALAFVAIGGFIFYNTNVLNAYTSTHDRQQRQVDYERQYKPLAKLAQPKITEVKLDVALYPREQRIRVRGSYALVNKTSSPIDTLNLNFMLGDRLQIHTLGFGIPAKLIDDNLKVGVRRYKLDRPLAPGETTLLSFDLEHAPHGFTNEGSETDIVYNGSFIRNSSILPILGYREDAELERDQDRRKFGLAPKARMRDRDDPVGLQTNVVGPDADFIQYEATVSTEPDQIAISPGYLQREWVADDRRYFQFKMDAPILNYFAFQSARYAVRKAVWPGPNGDVALEVYYQPGHEYNLDAMIDAAKASLAYNSANFGAYQYRQFRIIEFPRYQSFAEAFPNTIPFSEAIGFIARVRPDDPKDIDYPYYVTSHEVAHQWWAHQIVTGETQGSTMPIESFAQYSALMVMKARIGDAKMRRFLKYELDRYLQGRAFEQKKELPLSRVENQQYIHYSKGSLVMYAMADYIGEATLNRALREFRDEFAFKGPPYPNSSAFLVKLRAVTPPEMQYLVDDMFDRIVLYDNRAVSASAKALPGGRYEVTVTVGAKKAVADELGKETEVPLADFIDIGVVDDKGNAIALERHKITRADNSFTLTVDRKPAKAGIDPLNKLIDRTPDDNTIAVE